jgi:hypothetical protein
MKLKELKSKIDFIFNSRRQSDFDELEVCLSIAKPSIGPRATIAINNANIGIDWNGGQFILSPEVPVIEKEFDREQYEIMCRVITEYLWDVKDKKPNFNTKQFLKCFKEVPEWFVKYQDKLK